MRVLYITTSLSSKWGGPTKVVQGLSEALARKGVEISIFSPFRENDKRDIIKPKDIQVELFKAGIFSSFWNGYSFELQKNIFNRINDFDLVHIHEIWHYPCFISYLAAKNRKPYIITLHGTLDTWCLNYKSFKKRIFSFLIQRRILNQANALHALTEKEKEDIKNFGIDNYTEVIPNGINIKEFDNLPSRLDLEKIYPQLKNRKAILYFGRIHPKKGLDILARAFGIIARDRDDICLIIAGPDENGHQKEVEKILKEEKALQKVIFTGSLTGRERLTVLGGADLFVLSSYSEGFSMAVLEAMTCRLPVVITHQCNFPEVAKHKAGFVINPDKKELVLALNNLLKDPFLCKEMGKNGRRLILREFTWDKIADQMIDLYKKVLKDKM